MNKVKFLISTNDKKRRKEGKREKKERMNPVGPAKVQQLCTLLGIILKTQNS